MDLPFINSFIRIEIALSLRIGLHRFYHAFIYEKAHIPRNEGSKAVFFSVRMSGNIPYFVCFIRLDNSLSFFYSFSTI